MRKKYNSRRNGGRNPRGGSKGSWERDAQAYDKNVGRDGSFFHKEVVLPGVVRLLDLKAGERVLDLGCGQGVLARALPKDVEYVGVEISKSLVEMAKKQTKGGARFVVGDASKEKVEKEGFDAVVIVLALQNMAGGKRAIRNAAWHLKEGGRLVIVMNHPCFRIPRQSGWSIDEKKKLQSRWVNVYMSEMDIPIDMHPSQRGSTQTWSYHKPLSVYSAWLRESGLLIETIEEWVSPKTSEGRAAKMENRARNEIPLFMGIKARKFSL